MASDIFSAFRRLARSTETQLFAAGCSSIVRRKSLSAIAASVLLSSASPAAASETVKYTYDALGRIVLVSHGGPINQGATAAYQYDKADNRANVNVITAWTSRAYRTGDFNGDGRSDIIWRDDTAFGQTWAAGTITDWLSTAAGGWTDNWANASAWIDTSWKIVAVADVNSDGRSDILWRHDGGTFAEWLSTTNGGWGSGWAAYITPDWKIAEVADFNGDGRPDLLWRRNDGQLTDWLGAANGVFNDNSGNASVFVAPDWKVAVVGDFNGDGRADIMWRQDATNAMLDWLGTTNGGFVSNSANYSDSIGADLKIVGTGDFNGDGRADILLRNDNGTLTEWQGTTTGAFYLTGYAWGVDTSYRVAEIGNFNGPADHYDDILWRNTAGDLVQWLGTSNGTFVGNGAASNSVGTGWNLEPK